MANQITANPAGFMTSLRKLPASSTAMLNADVNKTPVSTLPKLATNASLGVKAKSPEQNIKHTPNTIPSGQVRTNFTQNQDTGLSAAYQRQQSGTANAEDTKNLQYAQGKGWKPSTVASQATQAPSSPVSPVPATNTQQPADITSRGILGSMVGIGQTGAQSAQTAQTGLLGSAAQNPATSGQAYTDYQTAIDELNALKSKYAQETANMASTGIPLEFQQGRQQVVNQQYAAQLDAAQQKVNQAQAAIAQQIQGVGTQQAGLTQAGTLGASAQGLLGTAAGLAQPVQVPYGVQYVSPQTGEAVGGMGGAMDSTVSYWADQIAQNKASIADVPATISGNVQLATQLQQAIQSKTGGTYNPSVQGAGQQTAAALTQQTSQLQAALNGAEANFSLLVNTAQQGGVNDMSVPALNTLQQNLARGLTSNAAVINFQSTLATVRSQYASILGGGTVTVDSQNRAQQAIPDNISLAALKSLEQQMKAEAQNRIVGNQQQINALSGGAGGTSSSYVGTPVTVGTSKFAQDASGKWIVVR